MTKGRYSLHSQSVQMVVHAFLANIETTRKLRKKHPEMRMKYPRRIKTFYPVHWPAQAVHREKGRVVLPMGKGSPSLVLPLDLPEHAGACTLVLRHRATRAVIDFCLANRVGTLFIGNPHRVRRHDSGRHHNGRMAQWEYGRDIDYLTHKSKRARILSFTGSERGTSSRCPRCGYKHKPKGRNWACRRCGFTGHRDLVGSVNMHQEADRASI